MSPRDLDAWLAEDIAACGGEPVLVVGPLRPGGEGDRVTAVDDARALAALPRDERPFALAIVVGVLEHMQSQEASALLATLRDERARRLLVAVPAAAGAAEGTWSLDDMLAHGLEHLGEAAWRGQRLRVYGFDIDRYKKTPDWLNARHWANPENWDRYRW